MDDPGVALRQMAMAMRTSRALYVAVELSLADHLGEGEATSAALAEATGTSPDALFRLLRALSAAGVFTQTAPDCFGLTEIGDRLRSDHPRSLRAGVLFLCGPMRWELWSGVLRSVRTGRPAIDYGPGRTMFNDYADHPAEAAVMNDAMRAFTELVADAVLAAFDFSQFTMLMDVGGGTGEMIGSVLAATPALHGILFDLPHVITSAEPVLQRHGVVDRCVCSPGDFFDSVPAGADAIMLKQVIHDWDDPQAVAVLTRCREAMPQQGSLLILDRLMPERAERGMAAESFLLDLEMLIGPGGRERTESEFSAILSQAGLTLASVHPTASPVSIIEAHRI